MVRPQLYKFIHQLELKTKKHLSGPLLGDWQSKQKGTGFEFSQLRDYAQGDDIRFIDWKSSAKTQKLLVREYLEERNHHVVLVVDASASQMYGSSELLKAQFVAELASMLALASLHAKDAVGLILFTDEVELVLQPSANRGQVLFLIETLFSYKPRKKTTNMAAPLNYIASLKGKNSLVCLISDFTTPIEPPLLRVLARRHEILAFRCSDERELSFPSLGTLLLQDSETDKQVEVSTQDISAQLKGWRDEQLTVLKSCGIDVLDIIIGRSFMHDLVQFLRQRSS